MDRRQFMRGLIAAGVGGATLSMASRLAARPAGTQPNVVLIYADDLGYHDLESYGAADARTPFIDSIADNGIRFTDFYAHPVCTPSRFSLLSGLCVNRSRDGLHQVVLTDHNERGLHADEPIVTSIYKANGYRTALIGKWHLGQGHMPDGVEPDSEFHPNNHGFDEFYGHLGGTINYNAHTNRGYEDDWFENKTLIPGAEAGEYSTHLLRDRAVQYINDNKDDPFFLYLPFNAPHVGHPNPPETQINQLPIEEEQVGHPDYRKYLSRFEHVGADDLDMRRRHLAMIAALDDAIGEVLNALEANNLIDNTVVLFIADNGGKDAHGASNAPLRDGKGTYWEGGIRIPAMMQWPGVIPAGQVSNQISQHMDMPLTLGRMIGLTMKGYRTDGVDLRPAILDGQTIERDVYYHAPGLGNVLRRGRWKYMCDLKNGGPNELFDLEADIGETTDLAAAEPEVLAELMAAHARWTASFDSPAPLAPRPVGSFLTY